jgi:peptidoglycan/xylan/chitin deacetylase (PgdA/CDA1 family)
VADPGSERWPGGAAGAISVTFDNLGEAAEQELGLPSPTGGHYSVTTALPLVLGALAETGVVATFFVEGVNAETYPDALRAIVDAGHECSYHAWHHEDWSRLSDAEEHANLTRGVAAMDAVGVRPVGFRPPGGVIGERTLEMLRAEGFSYCSPAGEGVAVAQTVVLPFSWRNVDAYHVLPQFAALRTHIDGSPDAGGVELVAEAIVDAIEDAIARGAHATIVLHTWLIDAEREAVRGILQYVQNATRRGDLWAARCDDVADWVCEHSDAFADKATLDTTSWLNPHRGARPAS